MTLSPRGRLDQLPAELLHEIIRYLNFSSVRNLSSTNRTLRYVAIPRLFECISVPFLASGLDILNQVAASPLVTVVKSLQFRVLPRLKNVCAKKVRTGVIQPFERIYPRRIYTVDVEKGYLPHNVTYEKAMERMSTIYEEQTKLIGNGHALSSLVTILQQFSALEEFDMRWGTFPADTHRLDHVLGICIEKHDPCFKRFMEAISKTVGLRSKGNPITSLQISACGMHPGYYFSCPGRYLRKAFVSIRSLHIRAHDGILDLLADQVDLPELRCLKITCFYALVLGALGELCKKAAKTLAVLHIETEILRYDGFDYGGPSYVDWVVNREIVTFLHKLGQYMSLGEVRVQVCQYPQGYVKLIEHLLRGEISIPDCLQFIEDF